MLQNVHAMNSSTQSRTSSTVVSFWNCKPTLRYCQRPAGARRTAIALGRERNLWVGFEKMKKSAKAVTGRRPNVDELPLDAADGESHRKGNFRKNGMERSDTG